MKKSFLRCLALGLCLLTLALTATGCDSSIKGNSVNITYQSGKKDMIIDSSSEIDCDYLLVYRESSGYAEIDAYIDFLEKLSLKDTAHTFQLCPDSLIVPKVKQKIILLGLTSYDESVSAENLVNGIRKNNYYDYLLHTYGERLAVNWASKYGREEAFNYILNTLVADGLNKVFNTEYSRLYLSSRSDVPVITVNDVNIIQYSVVVPSPPSYIERHAAEQLVAAIKDATGVELPLVSDTAEPTTYEILVGDTNRGESYVAEFYADNRFAIAQYGTKLILRGGQVESTATAVSLFIEQITNCLITAEPIHLKSNYYKTSNVEAHPLNSTDDYRLVYSDEFNTLELNTKYWNAEDTGLPTYGVAPSILYFDKKNIAFNGSNLSLTTHLGTMGYVTGSVNTHKKLSLKYGFIEMRAKFRTAPSYWVKATLTNQLDKNENVAQIDIFNSMFSPEFIFSTAGVLSYSDYYQYFLNLNSPTYSCYREATLSDEQFINQNDYHTYGVEWTETYIKFYFDGKAYGIVEITADKYKELHQELYLELLATVEMFDQEPDDEAAQWPASYDVDWIRIYQKPGVGSLTLHSEK